MRDFIKFIDPVTGRVLEVPETASQLSSGDPQKAGDPQQAGDHLIGTLGSILKDSSHPVTIQIRDFYNSAKFDVIEYNDTVTEDAEEDRMPVDWKQSWNVITFEQKMTLGELLHKKGLILQ